MSYKHPQISGFVYGANNPTKAIDPDGNEIVTVGTNGMHYTWSDAIKAFIDLRNKINNQEPPINLFAGYEREKFYNKFTLQENSDFEVGNNIFSVFSHASSYHLYQPRFKNIPENITSAELFHKLMEIAVGKEKWNEIVNKSKEGKGKELVIKLYG